MGSIAKSGAHVYAVDQNLDILVVARLNAAGLSPSRVRQAYRLLSAILRSAVESGYLAKSPCVGIELPRIQRNEMRFLDADEIDRLANEIPKPYGTMVYVFGYCGLRWGEAAALRRREQAYLGLPNPEPVAPSATASGAALVRCRSSFDSRNRE